MAATFDGVVVGQWSGGQHSVVISPHRTSVIPHGWKEQLNGDRDVYPTSPWPKKKFYVPYIMENVTSRFLPVRL